MGAQEKLDKVLARQAKLVALVETAIGACETAVATCNAASQVRTAVAALRQEVAAAAVELERQRGVQSGWFAELDKALKSAARGLYPSQVATFLDRVSVGVFAAMAVLVFQYLVAVVRNLL